MLDNKKYVRTSSKGITRFIIICSIICGILISCFSFIIPALMWQLIAIGITVAFAGGIFALSIHIKAKQSEKRAIEHQRRLDAEKAKADYEARFKDGANGDLKRYPVYCPACDEDLAFVGWNESDLKNVQICPLCGKKVQLYRMI